MHLYISIDDTDNLDSPGSGQLAENLATRLQQEGLAASCSNITRHQLFVDAAIPYTSHNSAMCFSAMTPDNGLDDLIAFAGHFLNDESAPGSDPGLCVAVADTVLDREALVAFGLKAKQSVLNKTDASLLAKAAGVHLSEHGGTGDGIIGALAGIGLRLQGNDGRFRGWLELAETGCIVTPQFFCAHPWIDAVVDDAGRVLTGEVPVRIADSRIKTVLCEHRQVIPVAVAVNDDAASWTTLTRAEVKRF